MAQYAITNQPPERRGAVNTEILQQVHLFEKCKNFTTANDLRAEGLYPYYKPISDSEDTVVTIDGKKRIMMGSNNYLGLTHHPKVLEASHQALERYGAGCTGSRLLNGTIDLHHELEHKLASFFGKEAALIFSTGYQANLGLIAGLVGRSDVVCMDKLDHASIMDGARMAFGTAERFRHKDLGHLASLLEKSSEKGTLVIVDGVYSMEGDLADVPALHSLTEQYGAALAIDEAHALGVLGPNGEGTAAHFGMLDQVELIVGTFSKSLASIGGYVAGPADVIDYLRNNSRPLIFTAALPPSNTAGVIAAFDVMTTEPERREQLWHNTRRLHEGFRSLGFDIGTTKTPIIPVLIGTMDKTFYFWRALFEAGVFTNPVVPPAVPQDACRLRTSLMASHTDEQIDYALETFQKIGKETGVI